MEIVIEKEKIIEELHGMSAHLGSKLSAPELIASTADDNAKIEIMLSATLAEVLKLLSPYATLVNNSDEIVYELSMPSNWRIPLRHCARTILCIRSLPDGSISSRATVLCSTAR